MRNIRIYIVLTYFCYFVGLMLPGPGSSSCYDGLPTTLPPAEIDEASTTYVSDDDLFKARMCQIALQYLGNAQEGINSKGIIIDPPDTSSV